MIVDDSVIRKLRIKPDLKSLLVNAPDDFESGLRKNPGQGGISSKISGNGYAWALGFLFEKKDADRIIPKVLKAVSDDAMVWFAFPKKTSGIKTDITRDVGWEELAIAGWSGISLVSLGDTWSAVRVRPEEKTATNYPTSNKAALAKTGKSWPEWYMTLNREKASELTHQQLAQLLHDKYKLDAWWAQTVTVGYEKHIGRRQKHQNSSGFEVSVSRTFTADIEDAYLYGTDLNLRKEWLPEHPYEITTATQNKSIRALWSDKQTRVSFSFYPKKDKKVQLVVQHMKVPDAKEAEKVKAFWKERLEVLDEKLKG